MGTIFDREHEPPEAGPGDLVHQAADAIAGCVPGGSQLFNWIIAAPLERRRDEWMADIAQSLRKLEQTRGINLSTLQNDPVFVDAVMTASAGAIKTSQARKREALRNSVLNAALPGAPDPTEQQVFLAMTERFTSAHLALLSLFDAPAKWRTSDGLLLQIQGRADARVLLNTAIPEARERPLIYEQLWSDLYAASLVRTPEIENGLEGDVMNIRRTTDFGKMYLDFIASPV
jgi:hypothetical protein